MLRALVLVLLTSVSALAQVQEQAFDVPDPVNSLLEKRWTGDLDELLAHRRLRVLVTFSRTNFFLDGAAPSGITALTFQDFERWLNKRLKTGSYPVSVVFIPVRRDELLPALIEGRGDIAAASLTISDAREAQVDFAEPLATDVREVVVQGAHAQRLSNLEDLSNKRVYVRRSSSFFESLERLNERLLANGRKPAIIEEADEHLESEDILELVGAGVVDYTVVDHYRVRLWEQVIPRLIVREDLTLASNRHIAWALRQNSPKLRELLSEFLAGYKSSGALAHLGRRFFGKTGYLRNPTTSQELRKFNKAAKFFKKYAQQYALDHLLMAAQGYQESRLDQAARSPRGAVGVMQLLPSTAAGSPVFLPRVQDLETNIHAGIKYHRYLIDTLVNDPNIAPQDRMLLAFAAYNAGPGNLARMRRVAFDMGLPPDKWFGGVEIAAGKVTGAETVRYVSNIYKYYVAYKLTAKRVQERTRQKTRLTSPQTGPGPRGGAKR